MREERRGEEGERLRGWGSEGGSPGPHPGPAVHGLTALARACEAEAVGTAVHVLRLQTKRARPTSVALLPFHIRLRHTTYDSRGRRKTRYYSKKLIL